MPAPPKLPPVTVIVSVVPGSSTRGETSVMNGTATCGVLSLPAEIELNAAKLLKTGSVFEAVTAGYRLFLFEFSINERFEVGPRTHTVADTGSRLVLTRLDAENVGRAVRDLPFGYVRVRAVTATSQLGSSAAKRYRR
jgi:hypothetical protein